MTRPDITTYEGVLALLDSNCKHADNADTQGKSAVADDITTVSTHADAMLTHADSLSKNAVTDNITTVSASTGTHADTLNAVLDAQMDEVSARVSTHADTLNTVTDAQNGQVSALSALLPPVLLHSTPLDAARARLADYRTTYGAQTPEQWLAHAKRAVEVVRATFAPERRQHALTTYLARYCQGQPAQVIAAHVIALELWAADGRQRQSGVWLDVACQVVGLDIEALGDYQSKKEG